MSRSTRVVLPARLTLRCQECGSTHTALALHDEALTRTRRCPECSATCDVVATQSVSLGCSCC